jgi:hypothetical protein
VPIDQAARRREVSAEEFYAHQPGEQQARKSEPAAVLEMRAIEECRRGS